MWLWCVRGVGGELPVWVAARRHGRVVPDRRRVFLSLDGRTFVPEGHFVDCGT